MSDKTILIVDDSDVDLLLMERWLSSFGHTVISAGDGKQALQKLAEWPVDLVLTDLQMPVMNGLELVKAIRDQKFEVPVILTTGMGSESIAVEALSAGAAGYIPKEKMNSMLESTVNEVIDILDSDRGYRNLLQHSQGSKFRFELSNDPRLPCELVDFCERMLHSVTELGRIERLRIAIAVDQAMHNALYRGNLEIDSSVKIGFGESVDLDQAEFRLKADQFRDRKIKVALEIKPKHFAISIKDAGPGFDTSSVGSWENPAMRGIVLMKSFMDRVTFSEKGNLVEMVYYFDRIASGQTSSESVKTVPRIVSVATGKEFPLVNNKFVIGNRAGVHLKLDSEKVASIHCSFLLSEDAWQFVNLTSSDKYVTLLNGSPATREFLKDDDLVTIGNLEFRFKA